MHPGSTVSLLAHGNGILPAGGVRNTIERNRVWDHDRTGIGLVPFPEEDANDLAPPKSEWDTPCEETRDEPVEEIPAADCKAVEGLLAGCAVLWHPYENRVVGNVVETSGIADLAVATADLFGTGETTETLGNCFADNTFTTSAPTNVEALAPCEGTGAGDWTAGALDLLALFGQPATAPPDDTYRTTPEPPEQENMPDARTKPAERFEGPVNARHRRDRRPRETGGLTARAPAERCGRARRRSRHRRGRGGCRVDARVRRRGAATDRGDRPDPSRRAAGTHRPVRGQVPVQPLRERRPHRALRPPGPLAPARLLRRGRGRRELDCGRAGRAGDDVRQAGRHRGVLAPDVVRR